MYKTLTGKRDVYLDVADRFVQYIKLGVIKKGEKLPSVREAAGEMGVNPNTVAKAYGALEEQGLIRSVPKKGAFVIFEAQGAQKNDEQRDMLLAIKQSGIAKEALLALVEEVYAND